MFAGTMLGQRIVEPFPELDDVPGPQCLPEPPSGLTIRRIKSAGLRIITENESMWPDSSTGHVSSLCPPTNGQSYLSLRTPDTSHTFGRPNPTMMSPKHPASALSPPSAASSTATLAARRLSRYTQAELALRSAAEVSSAEVSPQELQIRILEQATAMLSEQARDAQACAARLRTCLTEKGGRTLTNEEVKSLQRECWLEERRGTLKKDLSARTRDLLTQLASPVSKVPPHLASSPDTMTRQEANLLLFMQQSPTRVTFPPHRAPSISPASSMRRKTVSQVRPLRLRSSAMELALRSPIKTRKRAQSLDGGHSRRNSDSTDTTFVEDASEETAVAPSLGLPLKLPPSPPPSEPNGVIRIQKTASRRPRDTLYAEVGDVQLPDYAVGLLDGFVASSLDITLSKPARSPTVPPPLKLETTVLWQPPASSSVSDFADFVMVESPSPSALPVPLPLPISPASSRPSSRILDRLRRQSTDAASSPLIFSHPIGPVQRRSPTKNASIRASLTQSLHVPNWKFSSLRLSSPSLVTVPEAADFESRPQSSMNTFMHTSETPETVLERSGAAGVGEDDDDDDDDGKSTIRRRFSIASLRRKRFNSESEAVGARPRTRAVAVAHRPRGSESGILTRFRRRLSLLGGQM